MNYDLFFHGDNRPPYSGMVDYGAEFRLRLGVIANPLKKVEKGQVFDPLDVKTAVNMVTGKVAIRWIDYAGGVIGPPGTKDKGGFGNIGDDENSDVQMIELTHPFMWAGNNKCGERNWCGYNFIPPVGSVVIVGFRKAGMPVLLGYVQPNFENVEKIDPGEAMQKGYGNNWTYWTNEHKMEHYAWVDIGDSMKNNCSNKATLGRYFKIELNADDQYIKINAKDTEKYESDITIKPRGITHKSIDPAGYKTHIMQVSRSITQLSQSPGSNQSRIVQTPNSIEHEVVGGGRTNMLMNAGNLNINCTGNVTIKANNIYLN